MKLLTEVPEGFFPFCYFVSFFFFPLSLLFLFSSDISEMEVEVEVVKRCELLGRVWRNGQGLGMRLETVFIW